MKVLHDMTQNPQGARVAARVAARIAVIFDQYPALCGFSVQEGATLTKDRVTASLRGSLCLADVSLSVPLYFLAKKEFYNLITYTLRALIDEQPEASNLLLGRTFARTLH